MSMTRLEAERLLRKNGATFLRHGAGHDIWETRDGKMVVLPRHRDDLTPGVERSIKVALGHL